MYILASELDAIVEFLNRVKLVWNDLSMSFKEVSFNILKVFFKYVQLSWNRTKRHNIDHCHVPWRSKMFGRKCVFNEACETTLFIWSFITFVDLLKDLIPILPVIGCFQNSTGMGTIFLSLPLVCGQYYKKM